MGCSCRIHGTSRSRRADPTTLVFFCVVLGAASALRLLLRRFDFKSVIRDDGPLLIGAFVSVVVTSAIWKLGAWGPKVSLSEAAGGAAGRRRVFRERLGGWIGELRPVLNGPLFIIGLVGLLAAGRRAFEDVMSRMTILWLLPLLGIFGFLAGFAYPYYRFLNVTVSWILLIGLGAAFLRGCSCNGRAAPIRCRCWASSRSRRCWPRTSRPDSSGGPTSTRAGSPPSRSRILGH